MTIDEMKARKRELGYTNETLARAAGLPLGTVQKIFSGATKAPRLDTIQALTAVLEREETYPTGEAENGKKSLVQESAQPYYDAEQAASAYMHRRHAGAHTLEDYYALPEDRHAELVDGEFVDLAAPGTRHQIVLTEMLLQLSKCLEKHKKECFVLASPLDVQIDRDSFTMLQPDLIVFCEKENLTPSVYYGAPPFVVEILSPSSRRHDTIRKLDKYMQAGVREYWIVDPEGERVLVYVFESERYPQLFGRDDQVSVSISEGECAVDFKKVFDRVHNLMDK